MIAFPATKTVDFTYNPDNLPARGYGFDKEETYDVAILIDDASLIGCTVKGISVAIPGGEAITSTSGWLSSKLNLKKSAGKRVNDPDIASKEGPLADGRLSVTFDTPYTISGPFYAGYSFTVSTLDGDTSKPVMVAPVDNPNGLFIHSSRTKLSWLDCSADAAGVSTMSVVIEGEFSDNSAAFAMKKGLFGSVEEPERLLIPVVNHGSNPINSIAYEYESEVASGNGSFTFATPVEGSFGSTGLAEVNLGDIAVAGTHDITLTIKEVNGNANSDLRPSTVIPVQIYPFIPVNRPLVEEYTGLWCGWCVRGYVALETIRERYPDRFVAIAFHDGDPMAIEVERPSSVNGYPTAFINRATKYPVQDTYTLWPEYASRLAPAGIDIEVEWKDEEKSAVKAVTTSRFIDSYDKADFAICYALVADGLSDPTWFQSNAYGLAEGEEPQDYPEMPGELGRIFTHGPKSIGGLVYNDVLAAMPHPLGYPASVPASITSGESYTHSCSIEVDGILNDRGQPFKLDKSKLRVVAAIVNKATGDVVNSVSSGYIGSASVDNTFADAETIEVNYYDLRGRRVNTPSDGIFIKLERLSDGTTRASKIMVR